MSGFIHSVHVHRALDNGAPAVDKVLVFIDGDAPRDPDKARGSEERNRKPERHARSSRTEAKRGRRAKLIGWHRSSLCGGDI